MKRKYYTGRTIVNCMFTGNALFSSFFKDLLLIFFFCILTLSETKGQSTPDNDPEVPESAVEEFPVHVIVQGYNNFYGYAIYTKDKLLCVNIEDLFKTLQIPCEARQKGDLLNGFIEHENNTYLIDYTTGQIKAGNKTVNAKKGLVKEAGILYLESSLFAEIFGLTLTFNFSTLTIVIKSDFELPLIKQIRIESMRNNMSKVKGEIISDTVVSRNYHLLRFGTLDWAASSSQIWNNSSTVNHFGIGVGAELLGGEANVVLNYYDQQRFDNRQLQYLWRWVDNDKTFIKQTQVGKISNQTISFINAPIIGATVRNSPTTVRKATGFYTINEYTEPNWNVELYINNVMVDFTQADASGLYTFKVPNVYGYTTLKLKFYGPLGEERTDERTMNVPYTVMPAHKFEYGISGGILQDSSSNRFGKGEFNYGVNRFLTVGGGVEYLSSITNGKYIPYLTATLQPFSKLTFNGMYAHGVKVRGLVNYYLSRDILLEVDYAKYVEGQLATLFSAPEERKVKISVPFRYKKLNGFGRLDYTQFVYKVNNYNMANMMFSVYYKQISTNSSIQLNWTGNSIPNVISDIALSYRLQHGYTIRPSTQYNISEGKSITHQLAIEKYFSKGNLSLMYVRNILSNDNSILFSIKYDLPFARTTVSTSHSRYNITTSESVQVSLAFGSGNQYLHGSNNSSVGKGGISLYPFLDLNQNGIFDKGEHLVKITSVRITSGKAIFSEKDSIVRIPDLNPFTNYLIEFQDKDLGNISWQFQKKVYQVLIDPNQFKRIDVPVIAVGEVSGMAYINTNNSLSGIARILVKFHKNNSNKEDVTTLSESDGYIYYIGLDPGDYSAYIDPEQLKNLGMVALPTQIPFKISRSFDGDIISGIDFILSPDKKQKPDTANNILQIETVRAASELQNVTENKTSGMIKSKPYTAVIQVGAFVRRDNAIRTEKKLLKNTAHPINVIFEDGYYKVQIGEFKGRIQALGFLPKLFNLGFSEAYVVRVKRP